MEYLIALVLAFFIFRFLRGSIASLTSIPEEVDPEDVVEISQRFICNTCGTEIVMEKQSVDADEPPKHGKDELVPFND